MFRKYLNYYAPVLSFQKNGDGLGDFSGDQDRRICLYGAWQEPSYCTCGGQQKGRQGHTFYLTRLQGERLMPCLQDPHVVELVSPDTIPRTSHSAPSPRADTLDIRIPCKCEWGQD